jgi:hypothetical protein
LFVWQVFEEGEWGTLASNINVFTPSQMTPLITRSETVARESFGPFARAHATATGMPVRLARYDYAAVLEELP